MKYEICPPYWSRRLSTIGMIIIGLIYAASAADQFTKGNVGMGLAFTGWSFGQFGMAWAVK